MTSKKELSNEALEKVNGGTTSENKYGYQIFDYREINNLKIGDIVTLFRSDWKLKRFMGEGKITGIYGQEYLYTFDVEFCGQTYNTSGCYAIGPKGQVKSPDER